MRGPPSLPRGICQAQGRPLRPHVRRGEPPQRALERDEQQRCLERGAPPGRPEKGGGHRQCARRLAQLAERYERHPVPQGQRITVERWATSGLRMVICWRRDRCLCFNESRHQTLISFAREQAVFGIRFLYAVTSGHAIEEWSWPGEHRDGRDCMILEVQTRALDDQPHTIRPEQQPGTVSTRCREDVTRCLTIAAKPHASHDKSIWNCHSVASVQNSPLSLCHV